HRLLPTSPGLSLSRHRRRPTPARRTTPPRTEPEMDNKELTALIEGLLGLVPVFYPPAAPVVLVITKALPWVIAAGPAVKALVEEGVPAFEAAKEKAPKLAAAISELAAIVPMTGRTVSPASGE